MSTDRKTTKKTATTHYPDNDAHIFDELRKLDLLIQRRVMLFRQENTAWQEGLASHNVYISHEAVDRLLATATTPAAGSDALDNINRHISALQADIDQKIIESIRQGIFLALPQLGHIFGLTPFELQTLMICLAPELARKYDKLYAYLQDDVARKKPSVDLVLGLLCNSPSERWKAGSFFSGRAALLNTGILQTSNDPQSPSGASDLARFLTLDQRITQFLCGNNPLDARLAGIAEQREPIIDMDTVPVEETLKAELLNLAAYHYLGAPENHRRLALYFQGPYGIGKQTLARGICGQLNCGILALDMEMLLYENHNLASLFKIVFREALLLQSAVYLHNTDMLFEDRKYRVVLKILAKTINTYGWLTFLSGEKPWPLKGLFEDTLFHAMEMPFPGVQLRKSVWETALAKPGIESPAASPARLAAQFRLTPGQIRDAADFAKTQAAMNDEKAEIAFTDLCAACKQQSNQKLAELALKIRPGYGWEDLVLPVKKMSQLKDICSQVKHRQQVFGKWGFDRKLSYGKGLSVLFTGPPGTGKTMAAEVIARDLGLDIYKIDLSGVVSKYIGETEKNLGKIFREAESSNAILFFDEADALFGKRTEVSDARDRYANIETSYLLQKMEAYEGVVILASNLHENMDEAFTRRIRFIVKFPFPDEESRCHIWQKQFPKEAPLGGDIDYEFLSKKFRLAGGNIKNIALNAAFLAAQNGQVIGMKQILQGTRREFEKIGKLWNPENTIKNES